MAVRYVNQTMADTRNRDRETPPFEDEHDSQFGIVPNAVSGGQTPLASPIAGHPCSGHSTRFVSSQLFPATGLTEPAGFPSQTGWGH